MMCIFRQNVSAVLSSTLTIALTTLRLSVSMPLSSAATNGFVSLGELSKFTVFVLADNTASTSLRLNFVLRSRFVKSNSTHDANCLSIYVSKLG